MFEWFINKIAFASRNILSLNKKADRPKHDIDEKRTNLEKYIEEIYTDTYSDEQLTKYMSFLLADPTTKKHIYYYAKFVPFFNELVKAENSGEDVVLSPHAAVNYMLSKFLVNNEDKLDLTHPNTDEFVSVFDSAGGFKNQYMDLMNLKSKIQELQNEQVKTEVPYNTSDDSSTDSTSPDDEHGSRSLENNLFNRKENPEEMLQEKEDKKEQKEEKIKLLQRVRKALRSYPAILDAFNTYYYSLKNQKKPATPKLTDELKQKLPEETQDLLGKFISNFGSESEAGSTFTDKVNQYLMNINAPEKLFGVSVSMSDADDIKSELKNLRALFSSDALSGNVLNKLKEYKANIDSILEKDIYKQSKKRAEALKSATAYEKLADIISKAENTASVNEDYGVKYRKYLSDKIKSVSNSLAQKKKNVSSDIYDKYYEDLVKDKATIASQVKSDTNLTESDKSDILVWLGSTYNNAVRDLGTNYSQIVGSSGGSVGEELGNKAFARTLATAVDQQTVDSANALYDKFIPDTDKINLIDNFVYSYRSGKLPDSTRDKIRDVLTNPNSLYEYVGMEDAGEEKLLRNALREFIIKIASEYTKEGGFFGVSDAIQKETGIPFPRSARPFNVDEATDVFNSGAMREILGEQQSDTARYNEEIDPESVYKVYPDMLAYKYNDYIYYPVREFKTKTGTHYSVDWDNQLEEPIVVNPQEVHIGDKTFIYGANTDDVYLLSEDGSLMMTHKNRYDLLNEEKAYNEQQQEPDTVVDGETVSDSGTDTNQEEQNVINPTPEEENQATAAGFYFGIQKSASFFVFANSTDNYNNIADPNINQNQQRLLEDPSGFMYNEPRQDSMEGDKKKSKEFSMEKLGKVFNAIKDSSESAFNEIKDLVKQSSAKSGDDLVRYLELWSENNWNGEKAVEAYNETAVDPRDRAYFWGMFKRNVLPQIENLPSFVNAINAMSNSKAVDASDVNTSEYKYVGNKPIN